jgi:hypothetical protein
MSDEFGNRMRMAGTLTRRSLLVGAFSVVGTNAASRGMYCTRHPAACRRRREYERERAQREADRRARLTPKQRAAEDAEATRREKARQERENAYKEVVRRQHASEAIYIVGGAILTAAAAIAALCLLISKHGRTP